MIRKIAVWTLMTGILGWLPGYARGMQVKPEVVEKIKAALPDKAPAKPKKARHVLLYSKTNGFRHGSIATGAKAIAMLGEKTGAWTAEHSEDPAKFDKPNIMKYDAIIFVNTTGECLREGRKTPKGSEGEQMKAREEQRKANLLEFVKSGRGLAGTHSATDTYKRWKEFNDMMGGAFAGHPWHQDVPIRNLDPKHPVNAGFGGKGFNVKDEIYQFRDDTCSPDDRRILLALDGSKMDLKKGRHKNGLYPISFMRNYGKGRTFYCSLGHRDEIYWNPLVLKHYLAGFQFALGDLEADATPIKVN